MISPVSVLVLRLVLLAYGTHDIGNVTSHEYSHNGSTPLQYWIDDHDDLTFVTCSTNGRATMQQLRIAEAFPKMATWWSCECSGLHALLRRNVALNVKSAVFVFVDSAREQPNCNKVITRGVFMNYMTQWITVPTEHNHSSLGPTVASRQVPEVCMRTSHRTPFHEAGKKCLFFKGATFSAEMKGRLKKEHSTWFPSAFSGQNVVIACITDSVNKGRNSCGVNTFIQVLHALHVINSTLLYKYYENLITAFRSIIWGDADIFLVPAKMEEQTFSYVSYAHPLMYTYETFYVSKNDREIGVDFFVVLSQSECAFGFLLVTMLAAWAALTLGDCASCGAASMEAVLDSATFLVASFFATSAPIETEMRNHAPEPAQFEA
ncbi:hypothetical protein MRX96_001721 [Rhipicephalus microplus]